MANFSKAEPLEGFVRKWTEILIQQKRLLELSPLLAFSLEKNTSEETYRQTKLSLHERMETIIPVLQKALPILNAKQLSEFLFTHLALAAGG